MADWRRNLLTASSLLFITGVDGAGKSCHARWLLDRLQRAGVRVELVWSRFNNFLSKPLLAATRLSGHNYYRMIDQVRFGFHDFEKLGPLRSCFALLQAADVNIGAFRTITGARKRCEVVICERGPWDTLVDVMADTGLETLPDGRIGRLYTAQVRDRAKVIFIDRSPARIIASRPELRHDRKLERRIAFYRRLAAKYGWHTVDNNAAIEKTRHQIAAILGLEEKDA